jgi:flagellar motor switch protein FliG
MAQALQTTQNNSMGANTPALQMPTQKLTGPQRAAILLISIGSSHGKAVWNALDDDEITILSREMSRMGNVRPETIEDVFGEFISKMSISGAVIGTSDVAERLLKKFLPQERLRNIMEEVRGPAGRNMWEKLSNVSASILANYLKNEYPQTVAVILSKISPAHASEVLLELPEDFVLEIMKRMLGMDPVQREVLEKIEETLRAEFISNLARTKQQDVHEGMANIFNNFDRQSESKFLSLLEDISPEDTEKIKNLMFTFDDLGKLDPSGIQRLLRDVEKDELALAIKGTSSQMRDFFIENMSERAGKMLLDDIEVMGPVRLKDVDEAQTNMVNIAKKLADKGEIMIAKGGVEDEVIY